MIFIDNIKRIIRWLPILWNDRDWDSAFLFKIMSFKIKQMHEHFEREKRHECWNRDVRRMKVAQQLLDRFTDNDFYWDLSEKVDGLKKDNNCNCPNETFGFIPKKIGNLETHELVNLSCRYCKYTFMLFYNLNDNKEKEDFAYLWKIMNKYSKSWWN